MDAIAKIGSAFGSGSTFSKVAAPVATLGSGIMGILGNQQAGAMSNASVKQQQDVTAAQLEAFRQQQALQQKYANMTPQQFAEGIGAFQRPLSAGLTSGVSNVVQANMAERGLAQAPGIFSQVMAQALAPFQQQTQQQALEAYFKSLGLPIEAAPKSPSMPYTPYPVKQSTPAIWQQLLSMFNGGGKVNVPYSWSANPGRIPTPGSVPTDVQPTPGSLTPPDVYGDTGGGYGGFWDAMQPQGA